MSLLPQNNIYPQFAYFGGQKNSPKQPKQVRYPTAAKTRSQQIMRTNDAPDANPFRNAPQSAPSTPVDDGGAPANNDASTATGPVASSTRVNAAGVTQSGRDFSKINLDSGALSAFAGTNVAQFGGPVFPETAAHPVSFGLNADSSTGFNIPDANPAFKREQPGVSLDGGKQLADPQLSFADSIGAQLNVANQSGLSKESPSAFSGSGSSMQQALADSSSMRFDSSQYKPSEGFKPADYATSNAEMARRSAFLNGSDSLAGMKAVKAGLGYQTIGGRHFANTADGIQELSNADERAYRNAPIKEAQNFAQDWMKNNLKSDTKATPELVPANAQNPQVNTAGSAAQSFAQAAEMPKITSNPATSGAAVQFGATSADPSNALSFGGGFGVAKPANHKMKSSVWGG